MEKILNKIESLAKSRSQTHVTLIAFAGGYLLYLVYDMVREFAAGTGGSSLLLYMFAVLFTVFGLLFCGGGLYALWKGWYKENCPKEPEEDTEESGDAE